MPPARFGPYEVKSRISVGGMGEVFRARRVAGGDAVDVALKLIRPDHAADPHYRRMFSAEARIGALLRHPKIVRLIDFGEIDRVLYLAMELVDGASLEALLRSGPIDPALAAYVGRELLDALDYAHRLCDADGRPLRIVHRDISPTNLLLSDDGSVKLADFGVARVDGSSLTLTNEVKGKRGYMAPEQRRGLRVDGRADLFSVAVLLHSATSDEPLFHDVEEWIAAGAPPSNCALGPVLQAALAVDPRRRPPTARDLSAALAELALPPAEARARIAALVGTARSVEPPLGVLDDVILRELDAGASSLQRAEQAEHRHRHRNRRAPWVIGSALAAIAIVAAIEGTMMVVRSGPDHPPPSLTAVAPLPPSPAPIATPEPVVVAPPPAPAPRAAEQSARRFTERRARSSPRGVGYLSLDTEPWATAYFGGRRLGVTPFARVALPAGKQKLSLDVRDSGQRRALLVTIVPGAEARVTRRLR